MFKNSESTLKRILSLTLAMITLFGMLSVSVSAQAKKKINKYPAPHKVHAVSYSETSVKIKWKLKKKLKKHSGYQVLVYDGKKKKYVSQGFTRKKYMVIKKLPQTDIRKIKVRTYAKKKKKGKKHYGKATVLELPMPPERTSITSLTYTAKGQMKACWSAVENADGYILQYSTSSSFASENTSTLILSAEETEKIIDGLGDKAYYVRIVPWRNCGKARYLTKWCTAAQVDIVKGCTFKEMVNANETDLSGRRSIYKLTRKGVDIAKYETTYDKLEAIYIWHRANANTFQNCYYFTINFNKCVDALFGETKKYDNFILMADGNFQNRSGSRPEHKWPVIYLQGVPFIMDGRIEGYIDENCFGLEVGKSARAKRFLFDKWYISYRPTGILKSGFAVKYKVIK